MPARRSDVAFRVLLRGLIAALALATAPSWAADPTSPVGLWRAVDGKTGQPRALIRFEKQDGRYFGRIEWTSDPEDATNTCTHCKDERKDAPIIGLTLIRNMERVGEEFRNGDILDPRNGGVYRCELRLEDGGSVLVVRGYIGIPLIGGSERWFRVS